MNVRHFAVSLLVTLGAVTAVVAPAAAQDTRMLRHPTVSRDLVAFAYAGDLWSVGRNGGVARRLTATPGVETEPNFSPDGSRIAFTATHAGNTDVYVMPAAGGAPERLTYHPDGDHVRGWTPDGSAVVFGSARTSAPHQSYFKLWSISVDGGLPEQLPMPRAFTGTYASDGERFAYEEISTAMMADWHEVSFWRHYRGGRTHPIRIMDLDDYSTEIVPWTNSNDSDPMWIGNDVYFVSDRNHTANLFSYSAATQQVVQRTQHDDFDVMNAAAGPDAIVYEQGGYIWLLDAAGGDARRLSIQVNGDLPWARPHFENVAAMISAAVLSPTGMRTAFEARGDIYTVPTEKGDFRNLTQIGRAHV